ncbi:hypothetical protein CMQ_7018 [Grosmannia clavigera kw1407]|uniref:Uncharacterized protein n=1 Tax=Grosmannia clavigera (strain kw1407 / UAMH 11150) TaxID=655863 RepID=F0X7J3_GROCL|nr:uncharacterized protein CMQ_7018 [Grosmannia clavigera kw1407]EFX06697.1 hypothetical protein CMQ_7018 [Grosmannia clavigera kw1407]
MASPDRATDPVDGSDDVLSDDELDAAAIAAAMGFSSFGSQVHPNKKRRFNPRADAVVAAGGQGSGANTVPVAQPRALSSLPLHPPSRPVGGGDDCPHRESDDDRSGAAAHEADEDCAPQYIDTSRPVGEVRHLGEVLREGDDGQPADDATVPQALIDAVLAAGNAAYGMSTAAAAAAAAAAAVTTAATASQLDGSASSTARHCDTAGQLQVRAIDRHGFRSDLTAAGSEEGGHPGTVAPGSYGSGNGSGSRGAGRPPWWTNYYDATSNENPWARREIDLGLTACGSWLSRDGGRHQGPGLAATTPL